MNKKLEEKQKLESMTKYDRKKYLKSKQEKQEKKKKIIYLSSFLICIGLIVALVFGAKYSQNQLKYKTYATVGDNEISFLEYDFYYNMNLNSWLSNNYYYLNYYGLDLNKDFSEQIKDTQTGQTWQQYFDEETEFLIESIYCLYEDAKKNNFNEYEKEYDKYILNTKKYAEENNLEYSEYIKQLYGSDLSIKDFEEFAKKYCLVTNYDSTKYLELQKTVKEEDIYAKYEGNKDNYETVEYLLFSIDAPEDEVVTEEIKAKLESDVTNALLNISSKETFIEEAKKYHNHDHEFNESEITYKSIGIEYANSLYSKWLFDENRKPGDVISVVNQEETKHYILYFVDRKLDLEETVNFRIIAKEYRETVDENSNFLTKDEALKEIQNYASRYESDGKTEEAFIALANENNEYNEGLNEFITKDSLYNEEMKEWLFSKSRLENDITIIEEDEIIYLIYFKDFGEPYYKVLIRDELTQDKYNDYIKEIAGLEFKLSE